MALTDEGEAIEEGQERRRRAPAITESSLRSIGWHDGIHGLDPDPVWSDDEDYQRGMLAARARLIGVAEG